MLPSTQLIVAGSQECTQLLLLSDAFLLRGLSLCLSLCGDASALDQYRTVEFKFKVGAQATVAVLVGKPFANIVLVLLSKKVAAFADEESSIWRS